MRSKSKCYGCSWQPLYSSFWRRKISPGLSTEPCGTGVCGEAQLGLIRVITAHWYAQCTDSKKKKKTEIGYVCEFTYSTHKSTRPTQINAKIWASPKGVPAEQLKWTNEHEDAVKYKYSSQSHTAVIEMLQVIMWGSFCHRHNWLPDKRFLRIDSSLYAWNHRAPSL